MQFTREQRLDRACLRVAMHIRGLWEEKGSSDTRLLEALLLPDELTVVGKSRALSEGGPRRREHVVPRKVIIDECHAMLKREEADEQIARFIRDHTKIVWVTPEEAERLDRLEIHNLKQRMPQDWAIGGDVFSRLSKAGILWDPVSPSTSNLMND